MTNAADPVETGLVASLARPGGNITGLETYSPELSGKRLELLKEAFPKVSRVAVLTNPANPEQEARVKETKVAAQGLRVQLQILQVRESSTFDKAFLAINKEHAQALLPLGDPLIVSHRMPDCRLCSKEPVAGYVPPDGVCGHRWPYGLCAEL